MSIVRLTTDPEGEATTTCYRQRSSIFRAAEETADDDPRRERRIRSFVGTRDFRFGQATNVEYQYGNGPMVAKQASL